MKFKKGPTSLENVRAWSNTNTTNDTNRATYLVSVHVTDIGILGLTFAKKLRIALVHLAVYERCPTHPPIP